MYNADQSRPGRQTMSNIKPTDYVPFENIVAMQAVLPPAISIK